MLLYIFLILIIIIIFLLFQTRSPFWKYQPVYHIYNPINYFHWKPFIVNKNPIEINKYFNKNISCLDISKLSENTKIYITNLVQNHFLKEKNVHYSPTNQEIFNTFESHNKNSYISLYYDKEKLIETKNQNYCEDDKLVGIITSRPLYVDFFKNKTGNIKMYYVDFLCVHEQYRNQKIAPQLIQSHERLRREKVPSIRISFFRRDIKLSNIMPFVHFKCHVFKTNYWTTPVKTKINLNIVTISENNIHLLYDFLKENKSLFECVITPHITHVLHLIKTKTIHIFMGVIGDNIIGSYFFKNSFTYFDKRIAYECFGSIFSEKFNINDNLCALEHSSFECAKNTKCGTILYDNISHNTSYIKYIQKKYDESYNYPCAYYFYNFIIHPKPPEKIFIFH